ncbi:hypothetical protein AWW66_04450 [Micromonospora rosaria]|uniref:Uncharacterized protein n=1 Tax=Micromonospora rosaria TaxID=47874 RepID=A0A136PXH7_9ACTN|nr:hypothetical protein AWW66_04450 [Micromonospora rosaria]
MAFVVAPGPPPSSGKPPTGGQDTGVRAQRDGTANRAGTAPGSRVGAHPGRAAPAGATASRSGAGRAADSPATPRARDQATA